MTNSQSIDLQLNMLLDGSRLEAEMPARASWHQHFSQGDIAEPSGLLIATLSGAAGVLVLAFGFSAFDSERVVWPHVALGLLLLQTVIVGGAAIKMMWSVEANRELLQRFVRSQSRARIATVTQSMPLRRPDSEQHLYEEEAQPAPAPLPTPLRAEARRAATATTTPPAVLSAKPHDSGALPQPALPSPPPLPGKVIMASGQIGGRDFIQYKDASVELDTLLGRRRFISIEAAQEFVGGDAIMDAILPAMA